MLDTNRLNGIFTALVTPFKESGEIDWYAFDELIDTQLMAGIAGLVPVGTTGEAATLTDEEALAVITHTVKRVDGKAYVLAGTGSNSTKKTIDATLRAVEAGIEGVLIVTPYYNRPSQTGLFQHYKTVADECPDVDIVLYSVPGRAGVAIEPETAAKLHKACSNVVAIKEAGGDASRVTKLRLLCGEDFYIHCGDDGLALPFYSLGSCGLTSVLSNYDPEICVALRKAWEMGDHKRALGLNDLIFPLAVALFVENSPAPVKMAISQSKNMSCNVRLPLAVMSDNARNYLIETIKVYNRNRALFSL